MPNNIENYVSFICSDERLTEICEFVKSDKKKIDFNKIIPINWNDLNS